MGTPSVSASGVTAPRFWTVSTSDQKHFRKVAQTQLVAETPEDHERDHVGWVTGPVQNAAASFIELFAAGAAPEPAVAPAGALRPLRNFPCAARNAPHVPVLPADHMPAGLQPASRFWREE